MDTLSCSVVMSFGLLGHMESRDSISIDPDKTKEIMDWPRPTTVTEICIF